MAQKSRYDTPVAHKFILYRIRKLITDGKGHPKYMDAFDNTINEIFGVNHFTRHINELYDSRDIIECLREVGIDSLYDIIQEPQLYSVIDELTRIDYRINLLKKRLKKKNKRDKYLIKEYNYLIKLYRNGVKYMRKRFNVKNTKKAYKRKYRALNKVLDNKYEDDYSVLLNDNFYDIDEWDEEDLYEGDTDYTSLAGSRRKFDAYEDQTIQDDIYDMIHGIDPRKEKRRRRPESRSKRRSFEYDIDDWDDDEDDYNEFIRKTNADEKYDELYDIVTELAESVQAFASQQEYNNRKRPIAYEEAMRRYEAEEKLKDKELKESIRLLNNLDSEDEEESESSTSNNSAMLSMIQELSCQMDSINQKMERVSAHEEVIQVLCKQQMEVNDFLDALASDDDEDDEEIGDGLFNKPTPENNVEIVVNPPVVEEEVIDVNTMSREEMIDTINASNDKKPVKMVEPEPQEEKPVVEPKPATNNKNKGKR